MKRFVFVLLVSVLMVTMVLVQKGSFWSVFAPSILSDVYQGDLVLTNNNVTVIEGRFDINGSVIVKENATLILRNALLNFTQVSIQQFNMTFQNALNGYPRLIVENATITSNYSLTICLRSSSSTNATGLTTSLPVQISMLESASVFVSNSTISTYVSLQQSSSFTALNSTITDYSSWDSTSLSLSNCTLNVMHADGNTKGTVTNCTINSFLSFKTWSANYSVNGLRPGFFGYWNFKLNCSVMIAPAGQAANVTLIDVQVNGWEFVLRGTSNATVSNSKLYRIWCLDSSSATVYNLETVSYLQSEDSSVCRLYDSVAGLVYSLDNSTIWLVNSTSGTHNVYNQARVYVAWYLDVHVEDMIGQDVPSANVTANYPDTTVAESKLTDAGGWARMVLAEKMVNATGQFPVGNYTVEAKYGAYSDDVTVNMTENKQITLTLDFVIPEFPSFLLVPLFMITTLTVAVLLRKRYAYAR